MGLPERADVLLRCFLVDGRWYLTEVWFERYVDGERQETHSHVERELPTKWPMWEHTARDVAGLVQQQLF